MLSESKRKDRSWNGPCNEGETSHQRKELRSEEDKKKEKKGNVRTN